MMMCISEGVLRNESTFAPSSQTFIQQNSADPIALQNVQQKRRGALEERLSVRGASALGGNFTGDERRKRISSLREEEQSESNEDVRP